MIHVYPAFIMMKFIAANEGPKASEEVRDHDKLKHESKNFHCDFDLDIVEVVNKYLLDNEVLKVF